MRCDVSDSLLTEDWFVSLGNYQTLFVGFSGGLDSTVLLHAIAREPALVGKLQAVHVHHGLSVNADIWQAHCQQFCETLSVPLLTREVQIDAHANIEEGARIARYQVFSALLAENDCLLLGHHMDDQAETLLLQLFRGAGVDGMAAMMPVNELAKGVLARPLLQYSRETLEAYAHQHKLTWVDDESNQNSAFSRNYLRHQIMPLLREKWPGIVGNLARSAAHCQQAKLNLKALAEIDCIELDRPRDRLSLPPLQTLNHARLVNVLRVWLKRNHVRYPSTVILNRLIDEVIFARKDASPIIEWDGIAIRRYQQVLYLLKEEASYRSTCIEWLDFPAPLRLDEEDSYSICAKALHGSVRANVARHPECSEGSPEVTLPGSQGVKIPPGSCVQVRFRQDGALFYWHGQTKRLKKLFQQWQIPPWQRDRVPLLYINGKLAAVIGFAVNDHYCSTEHADTYCIKLHSTKRC